MIRAKYAKRDGGEMALGNGRKKKKVGEQKSVMDDIPNWKPELFCFDEVEVLEKVQKIKISYLSIPKLIHSNTNIVFVARDLWLNTENRQSMNW